MTQPAIDRLYDALSAGARASVPSQIKRAAENWNPNLHWWRLFRWQEDAPADRGVRILQIRKAIAGEILRARGGAGSGFAPASSSRMIALKGALLAERLAKARDRVTARQMEAAQ